MNENEDNGVAVGTQNDARLALMASIADSAETSREGELEDIPTDEVVNSPYKISLDEDGEPIGSNDDDIVVTDNEPTRTTQQSQSQKFKIKVNGKELELTQDELIERASKVEAADEYLYEAKRRLKETETNDQPNQVEASRRERALALARALQMGSEEEAADVVEQFMNGPSVKPDDLMTIVDQRLSFQEAANRFQSEYADLWGDKRMQAIIQEEDARLVQSGDRRPYYDRFKAIGEDLRQWRDGLKKPDTQMDERRQRKATVTAIPTASARLPGAVSQDKEESDQEIIAKMARARGQLKG